MGLTLSSGAEAAEYRWSVDVNCGELVLRDPEALLMLSKDFVTWSSLKRSEQDDQIMIRNPS